MQLAFDFCFAKNEVERAPLPERTRKHPRVSLVRPRNGREVLVGRAGRNRKGKQEGAKIVPFAKPADRPGPLSEYPADIVKLMTRKAEELYEVTHSWTCFPDAVALMEATLARFNPGGEERYLEIAKRLGTKGATKAAEMFAILLGHFSYEGEFGDVLGPVYQNLASMGAKSIMGQFFTPWPVAVMMAGMTMGDLKDHETRKKPITISDPACGSGVMLLAAKAVVAAERGRQALRDYAFYGQDIDRVCVNMCRVQMKLTDDRFMTNFLLASMPEVLTLAAGGKEAAGGVPRRALAATS